MWEHFLFINISYLDLSSSEEGLIQFHGLVYRVLVSKLYVSKAEGQKAHVSYDVQWPLSNPPNLPLGLPRILVAENGDPIDGSTALEMLA